MAAQVEVQPGEVGMAVTVRRLHLNPLTDSSNTSLIDIPAINQVRIIGSEPNRPVPAPKPRLCPKPFAVERNPTVKPILAPKPQTKPRPESTRLPGHKPEPPSSPKPLQPVASGKPTLVSSNPNRPASTSFKIPNKFNTGQTTKPIAQPFKPAPPFDPGVTAKPSPSVLTERQKPSVPSYAKILKNLQAAEWSGTTQREEEGQKSQSTFGTSITRAKSLGFLLDVGQEVEKQSQPEAPVQLRAHSRGTRARPVSAIFPESLSKTETPVPALRFTGRRPLSVDLTSKFEPVGLSPYHKSLNTDTQENIIEEKSHSLKSEQDKITLQRSKYPGNPAFTSQGISKAEETPVKETDDDNDNKLGASIKSRISLFLDSSSTPGLSGQGSDVPTSVQLANETESAFGVKMLIKQLTEDTTPTQSPVLRPSLKPRPLPLDLTKRFSSERSPDLVSLSEAADRHDIIKDPQRRVEESVISPIDLKTFLDSKDSQEQLRKVSTPEGPGSGPGSAVQTVRASLFENFVERHSVFLMDNVDSHSPSSKRRDLEDDGTLFIATYKEPASPSSPQHVRHTFDTVQVIEKNRAVSEIVPLAQWEDKAMTLRSKRSDGSKSMADGTHPAQGLSASSTTAEPRPRFLRVGALPKWDHSNQDQNAGLEKGMQKESQREVKERLLEQDDAAAAPKRLKMLPTEEQSKPRATYFALTGQLQEPLLVGEVGTSMGDIGDHSARSALSGLQGKNLPMRRNPSLEEAFGKTHQSQEKVELMMKSHLSSRDLIDLEKQRLQEKKTREAAEKIRQVALEQEMLRIRELEKGRQRDPDLRSVLGEHRKEEALDGQKKRDLQKETEKHLAKLKDLEKEKQRHLEMEKQAHREFAQMKELEMQREAERQRQKVYEKQKRESEEKQRAIEMQKQIELEQHRRQEAEEKFKELEREWQQQQLEREMRREAERMQERERKKQREEERQRELDKERRRLEIQKEKQKIEEMERLKEQERQQLLEFQKQKQKEKEQQQIIELENQRLREKKEREQAEKMKQMALEQEMLRLRELDKERERQKEMEREHQKEIEREKQRQEQERQQLELQKQKQREKERQQLLELEKQRRREKKEREEAEKIRQLALEQEMLRIRELDKERERQKEMERERQKEIEREKQRVLEQQRLKDLERERQRQLDMERQEMENQRLRQQQQEKERKRQEELERLKEMERQQLLEFEKRKLKEKTEKDDAEKMRQVAKQQEAERRLLKERQRKEEQERLRQESAPMRPKVLDLDSVLRNESLVKATAQRSDLSTRWKEPYKPSILDIDSFSSQTQNSPSKDLFSVSGIQGFDSDFGAKLLHTPERDVSWKVPPQTSGSFSSPVWTTTPQDPWELRPVEMSVDKPVADQKKAANRQSFKQDDRSSNPQGNWPTPQDEPLSLDLFLGADPRAANTPSGPSSSSSSELIWLPRELQPQDGRAAAHSQRRSQGSQDLNRMRSRSVSRRSAPAGTSTDGNLSRVRSRSAHREQDRHSWVPQKQGDEEEEKDSGTPVRDNDSQYGTWETGLRTDDSLTPATPSSESHLSPSPKKPTTPLTPGDAASPSQTDAPDVVPPSSSSESLPFTFPDAPTALLDTSVLRSRVQLGKKRAPRTRPTRAARHTVTLAEGHSTDDWLFRDSTDSKPERKEDNSDSEDQARGGDASPAVASQPQRVALFPGMDPSVLKAQLKKRGDSDNQVDGAAAASPSQLSRSPKSPFLPRAARVLPPPGGKENGEEDSPQWLKELKSKKRLSQYESET